MYAVERLGSYISTVSGPFHPFGGAVDIIVVQQQDGSFKSSPWYVKFGKFQGVLKTKERVVNIRVNDVEADLHMYLNHKGEAYFLKELDEGEGNSFIFSSFSSGDDETDEQSTNGNMKKMKSCNFDAEKDVSAQIDVGSGQTVARMNSRRSRLLGLVFGRKSVKNDGEGIEGSEAGVARASSLERAEIAADLLEVKWSTNLPTGRTRRNNSTRLSASDTETQEIDRDFSVNDEHGQGRVLVHDSADDACDNSQLQEASGSGDHEIAIVPNLPSLRPVDNFSEISTLDASIVQERPKICQRQTSMGINSIDVGNVKCVETEEASIHEITFHHQPDMDCDVKCAIDEMSELLRFDLPEKESETFVVQRHKIEESIASFDVPGNKGAEMLNFSDEECKEAEVDAKFLLKEAELTSELNSQSKRASFMAKDNVDGGSLFDCDSREFLNVEIVRGRDLMSTDADKGNTLMETLSSFKINLTNSDSDEAEILGDNNEENIEGVVEKCMELETLDDLWNQSQKLGFVHSCASSVSGLALGETSNAPGLVIQETRLQAFRSIKEIESHDDVVSSILEEPSNAPGPVIEMMMNNQAFGSLEEPESQDDSVSSSVSNFIHPVQGMIALDEECGRNNFHPSDIIGENQGLNTDNVAGSAANSSRSCLETSEEIQFLFSDMNHFQRRKDSSSPNSMGTQQNLFVSQDEKQKPNNTNESSTSSLKLVQEHFPICYEPQLDESKKNTVNSPGIPIGGNGSAKGMPLRIGSLPNLQSGINSFKTSDTKQPLSRSLDFECESLKLSVLNNSFSNSLNSNLYLEKQSAEECPTLEEIQFFEEFKNLLTTTKVEISLCKHLLKEKMGTDAASQAFDAERVDLEKFLSLGPAFLKNDRLIVRIGSRYFPWDAAEPIIVGMISCSQQQSMDPEGTVAANRLVETLVVDSSKAIEPSAGSTSGGSWRLWPFRASRSSGSVKPVSYEAKVSAAENVPDSTCDLEVDKAEPKVNISKKKLKSIVPTSKQLASLNLKEGQNIVTFSFSTTMLGKQQVDARIYLWKWNTRIVISDVDGTITRSDVLGQFMPLVGRDWSQIGVAHLFSAIKENGYQLLFLSARAISQAHLTRQFLFNLKQDGKALPDGPVVISPDGLFPSLFREVIRRAPHEFKIACLKDIKELFPPDCNPFYAGFGNRDTDEISYLKVGIPKGKIFIINAKGEVTVNRRVDRKSYNSLHMLVHDMFPAMSSSEQEEFNSWNYWRMPLPQMST